MSITDLVKLESIKEFLKVPRKTVSVGNNQSEDFSAKYVALLEKTIADKDEEIQSYKNVIKIMNETNATAHAFHKTAEETNATLLVIQESIISIEGLVQGDASEKAPVSSGKSPAVKGKKV